ncbi:hypothetical protein EVAR_97199_1 [Eumeta japonica]|uniref:Uncharacterized protein n=1 Tax=Eumeta variegata TaxID=151549 RepID=A0A4C1WJ63_EUMVA|nr:hypothetical protein EVAR_97199_1 [Eumeta japonica]
MHLSSANPKIPNACGGCKGKHQLPDLCERREVYGSRRDFRNLSFQSYLILQESIIKAFIFASTKFYVLRNLRILCSSGSHGQQAGALPKSAVELSDAARGLLLRLLERDPQRRLRSVRQLQQTAFYMGYKFDDVRVLKIIPRSILESYFPDGPPQVVAANDNVDTDAAFISFDQATIV